MAFELSGRNYSRFFFGLVLIGLGALFLLDNLDFIYIEHFGRYWPALFILFGLVKLLDGDAKSRPGNGLGWIFLGTWFLVSINHIWGLSFRDSWPILIIGWGISILLNAFSRQSRVQIAEEVHRGE